MITGKKQLVVTDLNGLKRITERLHAYPTSTEIRVTLPFLSTEKNGALTKEYNQYINNCGCKEAAWLGLLLMGGFILLSVITGSPISFSLLIKSFVFFIAGAVCGKLIVLLLATLKIRRTYRAIINLKP